MVEIKVSIILVPNLYMFTLKYVEMMIQNILHQYLYISFLEHKHPHTKDNKL